MKYQVGDVLAHLQTQGLTVTIKRQLPAINKYWGDYEYHNLEELLDGWAPRGHALYDANELESDKHYVLISSAPPKTYEYKYEVGQYFMLNNVAGSIISVFEGEYLVQLFYPNNISPMFFTQEAMMDKVTFVPELVKGGEDEEVV